MSESNNELMAECSDDENYSNIEGNYRIVNGKHIWEPIGDHISTLYQQLESKGFIELRWQCPGRRSPSVHSTINTMNSQKSDITDNDMNSAQNSKSNELNEFDFETQFNSNETSIAAKVNPRRRSNQGLKKSQTNLTKVMQDIKKYQLIDQQSKKLSLPTVSVTLNQNTPPINTNISMIGFNTTQSSTDTQIN